MNKILTKEEQKAADNRFRELCKIYYNSPKDSDEELDAWHEMYELIYNAASAAVKMKLKNVYRADIEEVILDTTSNVANMLRNRKSNNNEFILENKLVTLCSPYSLDPLYNKQKRFEEDCISLNTYVEDKGDACLGVYQDEYNL